MACPYFYPVVRLDEKQWPNPPRLPLGDPYSGFCRAHSEATVPAESAVRDLCNQGYARHSCAEFPTGEGPDAVRFCIASDTERIVRILFVFESNHLPYRHGALDYSSDSRQCLSPTNEEILPRQAQAYLESYSRRKA